jgi:hypothetical protein
MNTEIISEDIAKLQENIVAQLHESGDLNYPAPESDFLKAVYENMMCNYRLWHHEDEARRVDVSDAEIADVKRKIDKENQQRNDFIEVIDEVLLDILPRLSDEEKNALPMNSETPGSIIDRMSIAALKIFHMNEETLREDAAEAHINKCRNKVEILKLQRNDLAAAFDVLTKDLSDKKKQLRLYRQFKMYNDPSLNPALYGNKNKG